MSDLLWWQYAAIGLIFVWGGFVRSGLGFGGAALTLPLLLLIVDSPIYVLPIIAVHLLFFGSLTVGTSLGRVDWRYLWRSMIVLMPCKLAGVFERYPGVVLAIAGNVDLGQPAGEPVAVDRRDRGADRIADPGEAADRRAAGVFNLGGK